MKGIIGPNLAGYFDEGAVLQNGKGFDKKYILLGNNVMFVKMELT